MFSAFPNPLRKACLIAAMDTGLAVSRSMQVTVPAKPLPGMTLASSAGSYPIRIDPCCRNAPDSLRCALPAIFFPFTTISYQEGEEKQE